MEFTGGIKLEKLNNTNFHAWKQKIQLVLSLRELEDFINDDPPAMDADNYREWCKNDRKAAALICLPYPMNTSNTFKKYTLLKKCGNAFSISSNATLCSTS